MDPKKTKSTQKTGEKVPVNADLLRHMIHLSNNSIITNKTAAMLSQKLEKEDLIKLTEWFYLARREEHIKINATKKPY